MRILATIILAMFMASCGTLHKSSAQTKTVMENTLDSSSKKKVVTREKLDTVVNLPAVKTQGEKVLQEILDGDSLVTEKDGIRTVVTFDPETQSLESRTEASERAVPVQISRETTTEEETAVARTESTRHEQVKEETERTHTFHWGVAAGFIVSSLLVLFVLLLAFRLRR